MFNSTETEKKMYNFFWEKEIHRHWKYGFSLINATGRLKQLVNLNINYIKSDQLE